MKTVSLFVPCTVDALLPGVAEATWLLLRRLGVDPVYHEEQTCCGQISINAGHLARARETAKHFIEVFEKDEVVVSPSGSCLHSLKTRYPVLFRNEPAWLRRAQELGSRVYELSQYLVDVLGVEDVGGHHDGKVTYHPSCQLTRGLGVSDQPKRLIRAVKGVQLVTLDREERCCGFGGQFANHYGDISGAIVRDKAESYLASGADLLVSCEPGCLLNIGGYLSRHHPEKKVAHIAEFLLEAGR
jgi:L-lactate dehydrogenase complex protein LldE